MDPITAAIRNIIKEQQYIIGPLALDQARKVPGLEAADSENIKITGNKKDVLSNLVSQYAKLFGKASIEVCRQAFQPFSDKVSPQEIPDVLKI